MSIGMQIGAQVADAILQKRLQREREEASKATKGKSEAPDQPKPGSYGRSPGQVFDAAGQMGSPAMMEQRAGERMDFSAPEALEPDMGWQMDPTIGMSLYGSGKFTAAEVRRGYRRLGKA